MYWESSKNTKPDRGQKFIYTKKTGEKYILFFFDEYKDSYLFVDDHNNKWGCSKSRLGHELQVCYGENILHDSQKPNSKNASTESRRPNKRKTSKKQKKKQSAVRLPSGPYYLPDNQNEDLGKYATKFKAPRYDGPSPGAENVVLGSCVGSKYAGSHKSGEGMIGKKRRR